VIPLLRTPAAYGRPGPRNDSLDYASCRARALGVTVTYHRGIAGLGLRTAAACARITTGELKSIESGAATPTADTLFALADAYRTTLAQLGADTQRITDRLFGQ
jgi:transcriptional regulator with XRE-family HTH domain